jgi:hypothetical protein
MNKILLLFVFAVFTVLNAFPQAVVSGNFETGAGMGFGIFQLSGNDTASENSLAASGILQGHFQYAPIDRLSLGIVFQRNGFLTNKDSGQSAQTYLLGAGIQYRAINAESTVIYFGLTGGPSWMNFYDDKEDNYVKGEGYWIDLTAGARYYITYKAGIFIEMAYVKKHLTNFDDKNHDMLMVGPYTSRSKFEMDMAGMNLRVGVNFKFGKK